MVPTTLPIPQTSAVDARLLGYTLLLSLTTGVLFSIVPAIQTVRAPLQNMLQQAGRSGMAGRAIARDALVVAQIAAALMLLAGAGLLIRTLANLKESISASDRITS